MTAPEDPERVATITALIVEQARQVGFARAAIVPLDPPVPIEPYERWLAADYAGEMTYLGAPEHRACRADPHLLLPQARSMVVVALALDRTEPPLPARDDPALDPTIDPTIDPALDPTLVPAARLRGRIARYARSEDYHMVLRDRLVELAARLTAALGRPVVARSCVDAAPVLERAWAERAGIGFVAKNTMLISPGLGSHVMLGELLLDLELPEHAAAAPPGRRRCGQCRSCLDACPTGAFVDAYLLDARRCISYLTIEHRGWIPRALRAAIGSWIFGCDICQDVCPFNAGGGEPPDPTRPHPLATKDLEHALPDLLVLAGHHTNQLRRFVRRTSMRRVSRDQLLRNVAVALGNSADVRAVGGLIPLLSHRAEQVRGHAAWGLGQLLAFAGARAALEERRAHEPSPQVLDEIEHALAAGATIATSS
jgi:epoxyqueuosine reductase